MGKLHLEVACHDFCDAIVTGFGLTRVDIFCHDLLMFVLVGSFYECKQQKEQAANRFRWGLLMR